MDKYVVKKINLISRIIAISAVVAFIMVQGLPATLSIAKDADVPTKLIIGNGVRTHGFGCVRYGCVAIFLQLIAGYGCACFP